MHTNSTGTTYLPEILGRVSHLPVKFAEDGQRIGSGQILIARPDFHLIVTGRSLSLTRGPRENGFRPAIDPLFRSASRAYHKRLMGVILSGALTMFGLPLQAIAVILGVDAFMDMARTMINVVGNCLATAVMARWEGELDVPHEPTVTRPQSGAEPSTAV